jgi:HEPN superfamily protein
MFPDLQLEVMERFFVVEQCFRNAPKATRKRPELSQNAKGLVFVELYAIYEYTVREATRTAIQDISAHSHVYRKLKFPLLAVFLDPQLKSLRDCGEKDAWQRRFDLLERLSSNEVIAPVDVMPHDGSHFRHGQVELILQLLCVKRKFTRRRRHLFKIDEVVNNRNVIAHGQETAVDVGRRYSRSDISNHIRFVKSLCFRIIALLSEHCSDPQKHLA